MSGVGAPAIAEVYGSTLGSYPSKMSKIAFSKDAMVEPIRQTKLGTYGLVGEVEVNMAQPFIRRSSPRKPFMRHQQMLGGMGRPDVFRVPIVKRSGWNYNSGKTKHGVAKQYDTVDYYLIGNEGTMNIYYQNLMLESVINSLVVTDDAKERTGLPLDEWLVRYGLEGDIVESLDEAASFALICQRDSVVIRARYAEDATTAVVHPNRGWGHLASGGSAATISANDYLDDAMIHTLRKRAKALNLQPFDVGIDGVAVTGVWGAFVPQELFEYFLERGTVNNGAVQQLPYTEYGKADKNNIFRFSDPNVFVYKNMMLIADHRLPNSTAGSSKPSLLGLSGDGLTGADPVVTSDAIVFTDPSDSNFSDSSWAEISSRAQKLCEVPVFGASACYVGDNNGIKTLDRGLTDYDQLIGKAKEWKIGYTRCDAIPDTGAGTSTNANWSSFTQVMSINGL